MSLANLQSATQIGDDLVNWDRTKYGHQNTFEIEGPFPETCEAIPGAIVSELFEFATCDAVFTELYTANEVYDHCEGVLLDVKLNGNNVEIFYQTYDHHTEPIYKTTFQISREEQV